VRFRDLIGRRRSVAVMILVATGATFFAVTRLASQSRPHQTEQCLFSEDAARGRQWVPTCKGCNDIESDRPLSPAGGPNLHDVYLSVAGTQSLKDGYHYHEPLVAARNAGVIWTEFNLDRYLQSPRSFLDPIAGKHFDQASYMNFIIGGQEPSQIQARRDVIAYLKAIKGRPCS
jgi:cytochrome c2